MPSPADLLILERLNRALAGRFVLEREIGSGGMGTVFLAQDLKHQRQVAIKVLRSELAAALGPERFLREIQVAAQLHHPHILQLHDSGEADGLLYYIMPYIAGESVRQRLDRTGALAVPDAVRILRDVIDALGYAHEHGVVHRDIKPDNVLLQGPHALVNDFGIAKALMASSSTTSLTTAGLALGTPVYMAPEQALGDSTLDHRADLYAVGAMGYEMLVGAPPFAAANLQALLTRKVTEDPPALQQVRGSLPSALSGLITRALARDPDARWQSAREMLEQIDLIGTTGGGTAPPVTQQLPRALARTTRRAIAIGAAALGALTIAYLAWPRRPSSPSIAAEHQLTFTGDVKEMAVSPDGQFVSYTRGLSRVTSLNVLDIASGSSVELLSAYNVGEPEWSPDGREVMVRTWDSTGKRRRLVLPRFGGQGRELPIPGSAEWSLDGAQIYSWGQDARGIDFYTPATATHVVVPRPDSADWLHQVVQRPGGAQFAVVTGSTTDSKNRIYLLEIDSAMRFGSPGPHSNRPPRLLHEDRARLHDALWSPRGDALYFLREEESGAALYRLAVDSRGQKRMTPEVVQSALDLDAYRLVENSKALSLGKAGNLYYVKGRAYSNLVRLTVRAGAWQAEELTSGTSLNSEPRVSPDGHSVAYFHEVQGKRSVMLLGSEGGGGQEVTAVDSLVSGPVWSPDGHAVAVTLQRAGAVRVGLVPLDSPANIRIVQHSNASGNNSLEWAPGADLIYPDPDVHNARMLDPETLAERPVLPADSAKGGYFIWSRYSPDAASIAYYWNRSVGDRGKPEIDVRRLSDGRTRKVFDGPALPLGWSADGSTIFAVNLNGRGVWAIPATGKPPRQLPPLPNRVSPEGTTWHGEWFVFSVSGAKRDVWVINNFAAKTR